jgi:hypothetical protein
MVVEINKSIFFIILNIYCLNNLKYPTKPIKETKVQQPSRIIKGQYFINIEAQQAIAAPNKFINK